MSVTAALPDPDALIDQLDPDAIRGRLAEMERKRSAWLVLLRAALARRRGERQLPAAVKAAPEPTTDRAHA
jgi:hypothetical protein